LFTFQHGPEDWSQLGSDIDGEAYYDGSGESVSLSADGLTVAIGAHDDEDEDDEAKNKQRQSYDHGELAFELNRKDGEKSNTMVDDGDDDPNDISDKERMELINQRKRDQKDDLEFPDEVEVKEDEKASDRFARYRSLKSFRRSYWDPKENLPHNYSTVYHFKSFRATQSDVLADARDIIDAVHNHAIHKSHDEHESMNDMDDDSYSKELIDGCIISGSFVILTLEDVPPAAFSRASSTSSLLTAVCLLPHENKASVLHMGLSQTAGCDVQDIDENGSFATPIKSKDILTLRCGWRTWQARPVFSQNNLNSDKHKFERFLPTGGAFFAASAFGPVTYTPCPVLMFRGGLASPSRSKEPEKVLVESNSLQQGMKLVAIGSMIGADADRIVVKRIVLTGYPTRVHKRHATVKYMFYNPDDVKWFKPAMITTKHGLQGHILESVGDHGTMKCLFNAPIKQHDTVCLQLYKRIFPKYAPMGMTNGDKEGENKDLVVL